MTVKKRPKKRSKTKKVIRRSPQGAVPGYINFETGEKPRIVLLSYHNDEYSSKEFDQLEEAASVIKSKPDENHWLQIIGFGNSAFFLELKKQFDLHSLELEDALNGNARPKLELTPSHVFDISRMLYYNEDQDLIDEQLNIFFFEHLIISLQEREFDCLNPVRERIKVSGTLLRSSPVFYLYYAITDAVIDSYFPIVEHIEDQLESIEDALFDNPEKWHLSDIQNYRKQLLLLRKTIIAEKDNLSDLIRNLSDERRDKFGVYLQDAYDHTVHILDLIESLKELSYSLLDIYLSSVNNRLGEVMKVLTVISSIFIPLSFIAGFYGMNFSAHSQDGKTLPFNMPELYEPYGYIAVIAIMAIVIIIQIIFFKRKKWI